MRGPVSHACSRLARTRGAVAIALAASALALAACGGDDEDEANGGGDVTTEERAYLDDAEAAERIGGDAINEALDVLEQSYSVPSQFVQVMRRARLPAALARGRRAAEELMPPDRFREDHRAWVRVLGAELDAARALSKALRREDVLGAALAMKDAAASFGAGVPGWSEPFCRAMVQQFGGGDEAVCPRGESIPGGEYGQALHRALLRGPTEIGPLTGVPRALSDRETFAYLAEVQPDVERIFAEMREQVEPLDPPSEREADRELILEYLDEILDVARKITAAAEDRDTVTLEQMFAASNQPFEHVDAELSDAARPIIGEFFGP